MERAKKFRHHKKLFENFDYVETTKSKKINLPDDKLLKQSDKENDNNKKTPIQKSCLNCGKLYEENLHECAAKDAVCRKCRKRGHFARVCECFGRRDDNSMSIPILAERKFNKKNNSENAKCKSNSAVKDEKDKKNLVNGNGEKKSKENPEKNDEKINEEKKAKIEAARIMEMREKAASLYKEKKFQPALALYSQIIDKCPDGEIHYTNRAACYMMTGDYEKGLTDAKKSIELNPKFVKGHLRAIRCCLALGKLIEAELSINTLTELEPSNEDLKIEKKRFSKIQLDVKLFDDYFSVNSYELAMKSLDNILKISNHSVLYKIKKCECLVKLARYDEAEALARKILTADRYNVDAQFIVSICIYQYDADIAVKKLKEILRVVPDHKKALEVYKKARVLAAKKEEGNKAFKSKYYAKAHKLYEEALKADPENRGMAKELYCNMAYVSSHVGNLALSLKEATLALEIDPKCVKMLVHRGQLYEDMDKLDLAIEDFSKAYNIDPLFDILILLQAAKRQKFMKFKIKKENTKTNQYHDILGVKKGASDEELKKAYREKAMEHHPDRHSDSSDIVRKTHEKQFQEITQAYRNLINGERGSAGEPEFSNQDFMSTFCAQFFAHMFFHH